MKETKDLGFGRVVQNGLQTRLVIMHVTLDVPALYVKDIDEDLHVAKDVVPLTGEVALHEGFLTGGKRLGQKIVTQRKMAYDICSCYIYI